MIASYKGRKYILKGRKCVLGDVKEKDLPNFVKWFSDPEVIEHLAANFSNFNLKKEKRWFEDVKKDKNIITFGIHAGKEVIGTVSLKDINLFNERAEMGITVANKEYWGKGIGTEAAKLITDFGFKVLKLNSIYLVVHLKNKSAQKVYKKAGFKKAGILRQHARHNIPGKKEFDDVYVMSILRKEWKK
jgi:RimJ/RimL family protein N-acetyltransferase